MTFRLTGDSLGGRAFTRRRRFRGFQGGGSDDGISRKVLRLPSIQVKRVKEGGEQDSEYIQLLHSIYDAVVITDFSGIVVEMNARAEQFFRARRDEMQGTSVTKLIFKVDDRLLETIRQNVDDKRYTLLHASCIRNEGSLFPAEIAISRLVLRGQERLCFFMRDITERRKAENLLLTQNYAIRNAATGIAIADGAGVLQHVNPAFVVMWNFAGEEEALGRHIGDFFHDRKEAEDLIRRLLGGEVLTVDTLARRKGGQEFHVQLHASPNVDASEQLVGMVLSFVDITDRKRAEEAIRKANEDRLESEKIRARLDTVSTLSHEINNPLQMLLSMSERDGKQGYKQQVERIMAVLRNLQKDHPVLRLTDADGSTRFDIGGKAALEPCRPANVLLVDDEELILTLFGDVLSSDYPKLKIETATNGQEGVNAFSDRHHSLVIMDVIMPLMNGEEAFEKISAVCSSKGWEMPHIIFCTGFVPSDRVLKIVGDASQHGLLTKPFSMADLSKGVGKYLGLTGR